MNRFMAAGVAGLLAVILTAAPVGATIQSDQTNVFSGTYLSGSTRSFAYGSSNADLGGIGWDNTISSVRSILVTGHGIIFYTGPNWTDASWKICGPALWNTLPSGFDNAITSYKSTASCPQ